MITIVVLSLFPALLIVAAINDVLTMTIPNWIVAGLVAGFALAAAVAGLPAGLIGLHLLAGGALLALGFGLFAAGWLGGGDAKLLAAVALWLGPYETPLFVLFTTLVGGGIVLLMLALRRIPLPVTLATQPWMQQLTSPKAAVPYGVAIAAAGIFVFARGIWGAVAA